MAVETLQQILDTMKPYIGYIIVAAITFLVSRSRKLNKLLWMPVFITLIWLMITFAVTVVGN